MSSAPMRWGLLAMGGSYGAGGGCGGGRPPLEPVRAGERRVPLPSVRSDPRLRSLRACPRGDRRALVDPEVGTGIGASAPGNVSEYPGASVPLGMVQFSPDTSPDRQVTTGSGYDYADSDISGFSLTHLSGPGCAIYGDIPILPISGAVPASPETAVQPFSHQNEGGSAGNYTVRVGPGTPLGELGLRSPPPHGAGWGFQLSGRQTVTIPLVQGE